MAVTISKVVVSVFLALNADEVLQALELPRTKCTGASKHRGK